ALRDQYMRSADGFLMVYSIIDKMSFEEIHEFYEQILRVKDCEKCPMVLVGNKCDLESERSVKVEKAKMYAKELGIPLLESSARQRLNVDEAFGTLIREIRKTKPEPKQEKKKQRKTCAIM
ncbi:ras family small GTPase, partial [Naegleria gruberi]